MKETDVDQLRRHSLWLSRLTLFLLVGTALLILLPFLLHLIRPAPPGGGMRHPFTPGALLWLPSIFYLYSLWAIRSGFRAFAIGGVFGPAIASGCTRAGLALAVGATLSAVGVPNLFRVLSGSGAILHFDVAYLAVGVVGLALMLLGRLLRRAAELQRETAELRSELSEFF